MGMSALHFSKAHASSKPSLQRRFWLVCALWLGMLEETESQYKQDEGVGREAAKTGPRKTACKRRADGHTQKDAEQLLWVREKMLSPVPALTLGLPRCFCKGDHPTPGTGCLQAGTLLAAVTPEPGESFQGTVAPSVCSRVALDSTGGLQ